MAKAIAKNAPLIIAGLFLAGFAYFEITHAGNEAQAVTEAAPAASQISQIGMIAPEDRAYCANALHLATRADIVPYFAELSAVKPHSMVSDKQRASCLINAGDHSYQLTYDLICSQSFEPGCVDLVSAVRVEDGKILYLARDKAAETVEKPVSHKKS